ncbi:MAG: 3-phosphoshikimate 1-carboxyvinyltransferase [Candidatus Cloacimonetes bacterium]|nr:3-phosphoshikimate 1-carboxyvinyltransferase [Candidatus Cloacimonadota bacterium]
MKIELNSDRTIKLEGSKSILNRVLIIASFLEASLEIFNFSKCNDILTLTNNMKKMGFRFEERLNSVMIHSPSTINNKQHFFIKDSGTAFRFLLARSSCLQGIHTDIDISMQLKKRPVRPLIIVLKKMGADLKCTDYPLEINGTRLVGGEIDIPADISSQFISALLLIAPNYQTDLVINLKGKIVSGTYIEMTMKIMEKFGVISEFTGNRIFIKAHQRYINPGKFVIEPDISSACYFWSLGALKKHGVSIECDITDSVQPDIDFLEVLREMGAIISIKGKKISVSKGTLSGIDIDMHNIPDQVMTLSVLALFADSETKIRNIQHLRYKETDRINSLISEISKIGGKIDYNNDMLTIFPLKKYPAHVKMDSYNDHRLVMAFYILKAVFPDIEVNNEEAVTKSYPDFISDFKRICNIS